jgi:aspartate carbamoyltransferase catalytic subunit
MGVPQDETNPVVKWTKKDLLDAESLSREEIQLILDTAVPFKDLFARSVKKVPSLRGKTVVNLFYEPSTRTRTSFELAGKRLSADIVNIAAARSSVVKGESLIDTCRTLEALKADIIIMRHQCSGAPHFLASRSPASIVNAGDGWHAHPTQAMLDLFTIREAKGKLEGLRVVIIGDITHSRVARSDIWSLKKMGASVAVCGPSTLIPPDIEEMGVDVYYNIESALPGADVVYTLRIQLERQEKGLFPSIREYSSLFGLNPERLALAKPDAIVMHPGPMNRGVEIADEIADSPRALISEQVTNGVAVRMAILYLIAGFRGKREEEEVE